MDRSRPRRALQILTTRRVSRIAAPALVGGLLVGGFALAARPDTQSLAQSPVAPPVTAPSIASAARAEADALSIRNSRNSRTTRNSRTADRPDLGEARKATARQERAKPKAAPKATVTGQRYTTVALNVRTRAAENGKVVAVVKTGSKVKITATVDGQWRQIVHDGQPRWVKNRYLVRTKPKAEPKQKPKPKPASTSGGITNRPCAGGSAVESGLTPDAVLVHRSICSTFPQVTSFGGVRADAFGEHGSGRALDVMIADSSVGWRIAKWARANAKRLGVSQVLYSRQIWTVQRSGEGWRGMADRGSVSANHLDHVHITVYGSAAG